MLGKTTVLVFCIQKTSQIVFAVSIKFCDKSGLADFKYIIVVHLCNPLPHPIFFLSTEFGYD